MATVNDYDKLLCNMHVCMDLSMHILNGRHTRDLNGDFTVCSHESDAFGPYFEKVHFLNIQNKQRLYITHSEARHLHLINSQQLFCFCKFEFF